MTDSTPQPRTRRPWLRWLLVGSLVLNVFLIGLGAVQAWRFWHGGHRRPPPPIEFVWRGVEERLPDAARSSLRAALEEIRPELRQRVSTMRGLRDRILQEASQPEPDRASVEGLMAQIQQETAAMQALVQRTLLDAFLALPAEDRRALRQDRD